MKNDDNKPVPEKTREDELREWNESHSNSRLKAKPGSNKAAGVAMALTAIALCGFVYWLKHGSEPVAGHVSQLPVGELHVHKRLPNCFPMVSSGKDSAEID